MKQTLLDLLLFSYHNIKKSSNLRFAIKRVLGNQKMPIRFNGFKMYVGADSAIETNIIFGTYNEMIVLELIKKYAAQGFDLIDIGANVGVHSLSAASANSAIEIYAFEPESANFKHFVNNISLNDFDNIRPFKMGLGNVNGNNTLNVNEDWNKGRHSMKVDFDGKSGKLLIPVRQLDSFIENIQNENLIFKIDVEGFENEVITGAKQILQQVKKSLLIIELVTEINGKETCHEIINTLKTYGFNEIYKMGDENKLIRVEAFEDSADYILYKGITA